MSLIDQTCDAKVCLVDSVVNNLDIRHHAAAAAAERNRKDQRYFYASAGGICVSVG